MQIPDHAQGFKSLSPTALNLLQVWSSELIAAAVYSLINCRIHSALPSPAIPKISYTGSESNPTLSNAREHLVPTLPCRLPANLNAARTI